MGWWKILNKINTVLHGMIFAHRGPRPNVTPGLGDPNMQGINRVILIGTLGRDPEPRSLPSGKAVAEFSIATHRSMKDAAGGNAVDETEWHRIVAFGPLGEVCNRYLQKGKQVFIEGRLRTREWTDKEGRPRQRTEIIAAEVLFLSSRSPGQGEHAGRPTSANGDSFHPAAQGRSSHPAEGEDSAEDLPF